MPYDSLHCWLTRRSLPWQSNPMVYGCGCGVVGRVSRLTTSAEMRFFWLLLSTMKCSGVPFTHIYEWKRHSPSSGSSGSPGWSLVVATVALGSASMIRLPLSSFVLESESAFDLEAFTSATNDCFEWQSVVLCQGLL
jgi:hypothetical protein